MAGKAKVVLTDYVWESLDVEKNTLGELADLVPLKTKKPEEFLAQAEDCDALLNTYAGPITAMARFTLRPAGTANTARKYRSPTATRFCAPAVSHIHCACSSA